VWLRGVPGCALPLSAATLSSAWEQAGSDRRLTGFIWRKDRRGVAAAALCRQDRLAAGGGQFAGRTATPLSWRRRGRRGVGSRQSVRRRVRRSAGRRQSVRRSVWRRQSVRRSVRRSAGRQRSVGRRRRAAPHFAAAEGPLCKPWRGRRWFHAQMGRRSRHTSRRSRGSAAKVWRVRTSGRRRRTGAGPADGHHADIVHAELFPELDLLDKRDRTRTHFVDGWAWGPCRSGILNFPSGHPTLLQPGRLGRPVRRRVPYRQTIWTPTIENQAIEQPPATSRGCHQGGA
jgi:hypothetical protein